MSERISDVKRGDKLSWRGVDIEVMRVAKDGTWADLYCYDAGMDASWTKRQQLPLPDGTERRPES